MIKSALDNILNLAVNYVVSKQTMKKKKEDNMALKGTQITLIVRMVRQTGIETNFPSKWYSNQTIKISKWFRISPHLQFLVARTKPYVRLLASSHRELHI